MTRIVDIDDDLWWYVSLCTHTDEDQGDLVQAAGKRRRWLQRMAAKEGLKTKVAITDEGKPLGFIHILPIDSPLSRMKGTDFAVIPCLSINYQLVYTRRHGSGVGRLLVQACEAEAKQDGFKGLAVYAYTSDFWFMPAIFFQKVGFVRVSNASDIWVKTWAEVADPSPLPEEYEYAPVRGKVVIDYFWAPFCLTVCQEVANIRAVVSEFPDAIVLREYRSDDPEVAGRYGIFRGLFINGQRFNWGYAAPRDELRKQIGETLERLAS